MLFSNLINNGSRVLKFVKPRYVRNPLCFRRSIAIKDLSKAYLITRTQQSSPESLKIEFSDSLSSDFPYVWLRDSCECQKCLNPKTKQRRFDLSMLDLNITPKFFHVKENGDLEVVWPERDDDHKSRYNPYWLRRYAMGFQIDKYETVHDCLPDVECWTGQGLKENLPQEEYEYLMQSQTNLNSALDNICKYGFLLVKNVPCEPGQVVKVMNRVAKIKRTRWGDSFHITASDTFLDPACMIHAERSLKLHTDMDYLETSPGFQAIHCLELTNKVSEKLLTEEDESSKRTHFADGFHIANCLRNSHPMYFETLVSFPVKFQLLTRGMEYMNYQSILKLNRSRQITEVHYNNRLMAPLEGPSKSLNTFYAAYKEFAENVANPENRYSMTLEPGDLVIINNRRVLHGGRALNPSRITRHLESCFADMDEVLARYRYFLTSEQGKNV